MSDKLLEFIRLGSGLYKIIEERDLAYELARKFLKGEDISEEELKKLRESIDDWFDYSDKQKNEIKKFVEMEIVKKNLENSELPRKGAFILVFLLAWNMNRFKDCADFTHSDLLKFAEKLNEKIDPLLKKYEHFHDKTICDLRWDEIKPFLEDLKEALKFKKGKQCFKFLGQLEQEWVGSFKVAHLLFPKIFIPLDNPIAEGLKIKEKVHQKIKRKTKRGKKRGNSWNIDKNYRPIWEKSKEIFDKYKESDILKKLDEALYMIFSSTEKKKVKVRKLLNLS